MFLLALSAPAWAQDNAAKERIEPGQVLRPAAREFRATVIRVADGDTMVVRTSDFAEVKVRLYGIDAPEANQPGGAEATAALKPLQGKTVKLIEMDTDRYSRMVALVEHEGRTVNLGLVAQGQAWYYPHHCKEQPICGRIRAAEREARAMKKGLWAAKNPAPPWERWRARRAGP